MIGVTLITGVAALLASTLKNAAANEAEKDPEIGRQQDRSIH